MTDRMDSESSEKPADAPGSIFRWITLRTLERHVLRYNEAIHGHAMEVELTNGNRVRVFRADDGVSYFCHGLSFGGKDAPGGAVSPYSGAAVQTILDEYYVLIPEADGVESDIVVWVNIEGAAVHSAILLDPIFEPGGRRLDYATLLRSKNGRLPEADVTLESLVDGPESYGEFYRIYRRR